MPYHRERAPRLGHVPVVNSASVQEAFSRWEVAQAGEGEADRVAALCTSLDELAGEGEADGVRAAITVDGSDTEVEATREYPTIKVGYLRVAASLIDLDRLAKSDGERFVNPHLLRASYQHTAFDGALPGSGLVRPGLSGVDTWRTELNRLLSHIRFDDESSKSLSDMLLALHGSPATAAKSIPLGRCPTCSAAEATDGTQIVAAPTDSSCPSCGVDLFLSDALRTHEEYTPEGSNKSALTRVMLVAERLTTLGFMQHFFDNDGFDALAATLFVTDGPLALFGTVAPLKRRFQEYLADLSKACERAGRRGLPLLVGVEKSGRFVEHADAIRELIPEGHVMSLPTDYINRITGRPPGNHYGTDEFYGRRFIYRTTSGDPLVITVLPRPGVNPYEGPAADRLNSYPSLRPICEVLDRVRTRLYENAVIPVALAHSAAAMPLGVGQSVLRAMSQQGLGLRRTTQFRPGGPFPGPRRFE